MPLLTKKAFDSTTVLASQTTSTTNTGTAAVKLPYPPVALAFVLDVSAAATDAVDSLDVYVQTKLDGVNWVDMIHFTQVVGNGGAKRFIAKVSASLAAGNVRHLLGDEYRVRWDITDADFNCSFTFSVTACPM
jgi:hypothetical protein